MEINAILGKMIGFADRWGHYASFLISAKRKGEDNFGESS